MKNIIKLFVIFFVIIIFIGCSNEPPAFRVSNERAEKANVQIQTVKNTVNINDIQPGQVTNFQEVPTGNVTVTAVIQSQSVSPANSFNADEDYNYTVAIANTTPPTIRIDKSDK